MCIRDRHKGCPDLPGGPPVNQGIPCADVSVTARAPANLIDHFLSRLEIERGRLEEQTTVHGYGVLNMPAMVIVGPFEGRFPLLLSRFQVVVVQVVLSTGR